LGNPQLGASRTGILLNFLLVSRYGLFGQYGDCGIIFSGHGSESMLNHTVL
jgi:hypothetical protein